MWGVTQLFSFIAPWLLLLSLWANIKYSDLMAASCYYLHSCSQRPPSFLFKTLLTGGITQAHHNKRSNYIVPFWVGLTPSWVRGFFFTGYLVCRFCASRVTGPFLEYCWVQFTGGFTQFQWFISSLRDEVEKYLWVHTKWQHTKIFCKFNILLPGGRLCFIPMAPFRNLCNQQLVQGTHLPKSDLVLFKWLFGIRS